MAFVEQIRTYCKKSKYENELESIADSKLKKHKKRSEQLTKILSGMENDEFDNSTEIEKSESKTSKFLDFVQNNVYKKPWSKLLECHKIAKIKEHVTTLKIKDVVKRKELIEKLSIAVKEKKITKKDCVDYDSESCVIKSIKGLAYNDAKKVWRYS
jgi:hypothetical protein